MSIEQLTGLNELNHNQQLPTHKILQQEETDKNLPHVKPLTPYQHGIIAKMREGIISRAIMDTLVAARSEEKKVSKENLLDISRSFYQSPPPDNKISNQHREEENGRLRVNIKRLQGILKKENSGLVILRLSPYDKTNKRFEALYVLKAKEEMEKDSLESVDLNQALVDQHGNKELYTIKDLQEATGISNTKLLRSNISKLIQEDPSIKIERIKGGPPSTRISVMDRETFEKLKAIINVGEKKQRDTENQGLASQEKTLRTKKVGPFDNEYEERQIISKTKEQIREDLGMNVTTIILSHLAKDILEELTKDPKELVKNHLPSKKTLESIISESTQEFLTDNLVKVLEALWNKDATRTNSVNEIRTLGYCLELKQKGYTVNGAVEIICKHFSIPNPLISSPVH